MSQAVIIPSAFGASIGVVTILVAILLQPVAAQEANRHKAIADLGNALKAAGVELEEDKLLMLDTGTVQPRADAQDLRWQLFRSGQRINAYLTQYGGATAKLTGLSKERYCQLALLESYAKANAGKFKVNRSNYQLELPKWTSDLVHQLEKLPLPEDCKYNI